MTGKKCNPCKVTRVSPYSRSDEKSYDRLEDKKDEYCIKVTSYIKGAIKNSFIEECQRRGERESEVARQIIVMHFALLKRHPELKGKEFSEIQEFFSE